ncbi:MAG: aminotransferase class V-fold PLP-dependent enzyme [Solirubrobacteraceae bacterium]
MDARRLRAEFPVLERLAFLNAGTDGPVAAASVAAATTELERQVARGRTREHADRRREMQAAQRAAYADLLGCRPADVALTTSTTDAVHRAVGGLGLRAGDDVLTSDEEHPGLLGPLQAARDLLGVAVRQVPLGDLPDAVTPATRLIACSHVSWITGAVAPAALADAGVPVLLDGAQAVGAVPVAVGSLGCELYAASGQKWLCGPDGSGMLYVSPAMRDRLGATARSYGSFGDPGAGLEATLFPDARRHDTPTLAAETSAFALAGLETLARAGWPAVHERARRLADDLAGRLRREGRAVCPRGSTTLVSWRCDDAEAARDRLARAGVVVRDIPGRPLLRASVGAWNEESDLDRLLDALA